MAKFCHIESLSPTDPEAGETGQERRHRTRHLQAAQRGHRHHRISEAVKKMWEEAENNGQTLDGVPHLKRNQETEPILARLFQQMAKVDHTAYVYRIVPGTVKKAKQPDGNPPLIIRFSRSRVEAQQGSQTYSRSLGSNRWRIVPLGEDQYRTDKQ